MRLNNTFNVGEQTYLFFPPPKTGTRSFGKVILEGGLFSGPDFWHNPRVEYYDGIDRTGWKYIMLVRNPFNRMRSLWRGVHHMQGWNRKLTFKRWVRGYYQYFEELVGMANSGIPCDHRDPKLICLDGFAETLTNYWMYYVAPFNPELVHLIRLEHRADDWNALGIFPYPVNKSNDNHYKGTIDHLDDVEYYDLNPDVYQVVKWMLADDLVNFQYDDTVYDGYGKVKNYTVSREQSDIEFAETWQGTGLILD